MTVSIVDGVPHIAGKPYAWAAFVEVEDVLFVDDDDVLRPFRIRRFLLAFENAWSVSVTFGDGTYSSNRRAWWDGEFTEEPDVVEVAVVKRDGSLLADPESMDARDLILLIDVVSGFPSSARSGHVLE